jgi:hypothetical protein
MSENWVNYFVNFKAGGHVSFMVICPNCGFLGNVIKHRRNAVCVSHKSGSKRCVITWNPAFQLFADHVNSTVCHVNATKVKKYIREGEYIVKEYKYLDCVAPNKAGGSQNLVIN